MALSNTPTASDNPLRHALFQSVDEITDEARAASSLGAMVMVVVAGMRKIGLALLAGLLEERDLPYRRREVTVVCPKCSSKMSRQKNLRKIKRKTLLGELTYRRCTYCCPKCHQRIFPLDQSLSLLPALRGHGEHVGNHLVLLCTLMPFSKGCELFERFFGYAVSTRLARGLTLTIGLRLFLREMERAEEFWKLRYQQPELFEPLPATLRNMKRHNRVYVMMDNSKVGIQQGKRGRKAPKRKTLHKMTQHELRKAVSAAKKHPLGPEPPPGIPPDAESENEEDGWRDVRALLVFREEDLVQSSKSRREILHRRVIAHVGTKEEWMKLVHMALYEEGVYTAREVVIVADGGPGIWELFDEMLPSTPFRQVIPILDWYHAASYLWKVGRAIKGHRTEKQKRACAAWVQPLLSYLAKGKVANVIQRLNKIKNAPASASKTLENSIEYFEKHRQRMRYAWCRSHELLIGSGPIESVHSWVIQARCCLPGMRWTLKGVNAMLRLRSSWASQRWDDAFLEAAACEPMSTRDLEVAEAA